MAILGIDVGGTFTDAVLLDGDELRTAKVPTAGRQEESVVAAARAVGRADVERFTHGTTVATNALLERKGARTAFVATAGFEHLLHLRRQNRAHLYRLCADHPEPLVPLERCFGVRERIGPEGVIEPLDLDSLPELDAEAVAVCLLFAFRDPSHERAVADELRRRMPAGARRRLARDVARVPRVRARLDDGGRRLSRAGGSRVPRALAARVRGGGTARAARDALVGRGGDARGGGGASVLGARLRARPRASSARSCVARAAGVANAISFDMGGTSTDVCLSRAARASRSAERAVGGLPVRLPTVDLQTVGAGGGSIVWRDAGGALRVGPESAGADPAPPATGAAEHARPSPTRTCCSAGCPSASRAGSSSTGGRRARAERDRPGGGGRGRER